MYSNPEMLDGRVGVWGTSTAHSFFFFFFFLPRNRYLEKVRNMMRYCGWKSFSRTMDIPPPLSSPDLCRRKRCSVKIWKGSKNWLHSICTDGNRQMKIKEFYTVSFNLRIHIQRLLEEIILYDFKQLSVMILNKLFKEIVL